MKLGLSECLLGTACRYDGAGSRDRFITDVLSDYFEFVPYCPERLIFPTPREAIRQVEIDGKIEIETSNTKRRVTQEVQEISDRLAEDVMHHHICGYILKSKSPTCGLERVKVYQPKNAPSEKKGVGLFAQALLERYPYLPIEEEGRLLDPWLRENFLMQVFAYEDLRNFLAGEPQMRELVAFHTAYKYLIYAKSTQSYKALGNVVANKEKKPLDQVLHAYRLGFLHAISLKGNVAKTYNVLLHIYGYFKKLITPEERQFMLGTIEEYRDKVVPLIAVTKIINLYVQRFDVAYLQKQKFLNPYPEKLALRSELEAYK